VLCHNRLFNIEWNQLLEQQRHLNLDGLDLSFVDLHFLIFNTVPVSWHSHLLDNLVGNSPFHFHLDRTIPFNDPLNYSLNFYDLNLFLNLNHYPFDDDLYWSFYFLNDHIRDLNLNNLEYGLLHYNYFLYDLWHLYYPLNYSRDYYNFLYYLLYLDNPWHFHNLLYDSLHDLCLNFYELFLDHDWNWFFNVNGFNNLLFHGNQNHFLNVKLFDLLWNIGDWNLVNYWYLLGNIKWNNFVDFGVFACQNLMNYRFVNVNLDFSNNFNLIWLDKMRSFDENLFGRLP